MFFHGIETVAFSFMRLLHKYLTFNCLGELTSLQTEIRQMTRLFGSDNFLQVILIVALSRNTKLRALGNNFLCFFWSIQTFDNKLQRVPLEK